jgi:hypothetical protein
MKLLNRFEVSLALLVSLSTVSGYSQTPAPSPETLEHRVDVLEKRLNALESIPAIAIALKMIGTAQLARPPVPTASAQKDAPLEIADWSYSFRDAQYDYQKAHVISYTLKNRTDKAIKLVQDSIVFRDLLDEKILQLDFWRTFSIRLKDRREQAAHGASIRSIRRSRGCRLFSTTISSQI